MVDQAHLATLARTLGGLLEPVIGQVYFSPECHANYAALGFDPSVADAGGVALPDGPAYFTSRGSVMGQVPGQVVAAAFAVFNPAVVIPCVQLGWSRTDAGTICAARHDGAVAQLRRLLGDEPAGLSRAVEILQRLVEPLRPEGRPLFAGLLSQSPAAEPLARMWQLGDCLREYRGDSHTAAWVSAGLTATEIGLLTELFWGLSLRTYSRTRAWSDDQLDAATDSLGARGWIANGAFTEVGRNAREAIEIATDAQQRPAIDALGDDANELFAILAPWGEAVRAGKGYLGSGPHDLADKAAGNPVDTTD